MLFKIQKNWSLLVLLSYFLLLFSSITQWTLTEGASAYNGPGIDMVGYFKNQDNSSILQNDFLVQSYHGDSPRHVFSTIITVTGKLLGGDWYSGFYFWKVIFVISLPVAWVCLIKSCIFLAKSDCKPVHPATEIIVIAFVIAMVWDYIPVPVINQYSVRGYFSVAWWPPSNNYVHPQTFSILLGLFAAILSAKRKVFFGINPILIIATLIHPSVSFAGYLFVAVAEIAPNYRNKVNRIKQVFLEILLGYIVPALGLLYFFGEESLLSAEVFNYIYINQAHPSHYLPAEFGSLGGQGSWFAFCFVIFILAAFGLIAYRNKLPNVVRVSLTFAAAYVFFMLAQFILVYYVNLKALTQLGPIRLTMLGYWFVVVTVTLYVNEKFSPQNVTLEKYYLFKKYLYALFTALVVIVSSFTTIVFRDLKPEDNLPESAVSVIRWAKLNTNIESTFAVPFGHLTYSIPFSANRAVFGGTGFPFSESRMIEYCFRDQMLFGSPSERSLHKGSWIGHRMAQVYNSRKPGHFVEMANHADLDYVIIQTNKKTGDWLKLSPLFDDKHWTVYSVDEMAEVYTPEIPHLLKNEKCLLLFTSVFEEQL